MKFHNRMVKKRSVHIVLYVLDLFGNLSTSIWTIIEVRLHKTHQ